MHRRKFLSSALAAPLAAQGPRIRMAFLGATHPHAAAKIQTVRASGDYELAGVAESDPQVRSRLEKAGVSILSRERLLGDASIRVVAVESAVKEHAADALAALEAGKHVHVEKPPATDVEGLARLLALAGKKGLLLQPGYMWRYHPGIAKALEAARQGWLGEVFLVRGTINTLLDAAQRRDIAGFRGGQMFELGCHLIDPLVRLLGRPVKVTPVLQKLGADPLADNTAATFEFPRAIGIVVSASMHPAANRHRAFEIFGAGGSAVVRPIEPATLEIDLARAAGPYTVNRQAVALPPYARYVEDFARLAEAVRGARPLGVTPEEEMAVQAAVLAAAGM
jgi:predicted dehydrogenase